MTETATASPYASLEGKVRYTLADFDADAHGDFIPLSLWVATKHPDKFKDPGHVRRVLEANCGWSLTETDMEVHMTTVLAFAAATDLSPLEYARVAGDVLAVRILQAKAAEAN